jgi:hypothetical protein
MKTLILSGEAIAGAFDAVVAHPWGFAADGVEFPFVSGVSGSVEVESLPADFSTARYVWRGGELVSVPDPSIDMAALRKAAFDRAMAVGNKITAAITGTYSDAEARTWAIQEEEARIVVAGASLPAWALLPGLAADKGETTQIYAARVVARADAFKAIVRAGVRLRRGAEGLLSPSLDTPDKLTAAVEALRVAAAAEAATFGLPPP